MNNGIRLACLGVAMKIWGRDEEHRSRFQTRRGEYARIGELSSLPQAALRRLRTSANSVPVPWIAPDAIERLAAEMDSTTRVLELGAGRSTLWYADRVASIRSLEPDPVWASEVSRLMRDCENVDLIGGSICETLPPALDEEYDIVIIDHNDEPDMTRIDAFNLIRDLKNPPRIVVLDDSDRSEYAAALRHGIHRDLKVEVFRGFRDSPLRLTETTIFIRESS